MERSTHWEGTGSALSSPSVYLVGWANRLVREGGLLQGCTAAGSGWVNHQHAHSVRFLLGRGVHHLCCLWLLLLSCCCCPCCPIIDVHRCPLWLSIVCLDHPSWLSIMVTVCHVSSVMVVCHVIMCHGPGEHLQDGDRWVAVHPHPGYVSFGGLAVFLVKVGSE